MPPTNFSSSGSVFGPPPLGMRSYSLRSAWYCSAGVGGLSWPLPLAATTDRLSIRTRVPLTARCTGVLHNPPARTTDEVGPRNTAARSGRRGNGTQQHTGNLRAGQRRIEPRRTRNRAGSREAFRSPGLAILAACGRTRVSVLRTGPSSVPESRSRVLGTYRRKLELPFDLTAFVAWTTRRCLGLGGWRMKATA